MQDYGRVTKLHRPLETNLYKTVCPLSVLFFMHILDCDPQKFQLSMVRRQLSTLHLQR